MQIITRYILQRRSNFKTVSLNQQKFFRSNSAMNGTITLNDAQEDQILKYTIDNFSSYTRPKVQNKEDEKKILLLQM